MTETGQNDCQHNLTPETEHEQKNETIKKNIRFEKEPGVIYLENTWTFWYDEKVPKGTTCNVFEGTTKKIGSFSTVQDFWRYWNNIIIINLPDYSNLRLFKEGIKPTWEDPANINGGKWVLYSNKEEANKMWSHLVLALIGEQFEFGDELCGTVLSIRPKSNTINLWNKRADDIPQIDLTTKYLRRLLNLNESEEVIYQNHLGTASFNSNYKNSKKTKKSKKSKRTVTPKAGHQRVRSSDSYNDYPDEDFDPSPNVYHDADRKVNTNVNFPRGHKKSSSFSSSPYDRNNWSRNRLSPRESNEVQVHAMIATPPTPQPKQAARSSLDSQGSSSNQGNKNHNYVQKKEVGPTHRRSLSSGSNNSRVSKVICPRPPLYPSSSSCEDLVQQSRSLPCSPASSREEPVKTCDVDLSTTVSKKEILPIHNPLSRANISFLTLSMIVAASLLIGTLLGLLSRPILL
eukprot:TRINITY_DN911_c0_g2_i1.p1 TRINITY_DN911_c0_g2~~TRINITY_DN911_c0_g2_i1.p1  ORF type:complete len:459 (-),score=74.64 TRINITY_DN911_c0_g2_i1:17-1393(-)